MGSSEAFAGTHYLATQWLVRMRVVEGIEWVGVGGVVEIIPNRINRVRGPDLKHRFPRLLSGRFEASRAN